MSRENSHSQKVENRLRILKKIEDNPKLKQETQATRLDIGTGTVNRYINSDLSPVLNCNVEQNNKRSYRAQPKRPSAVTRTANCANIAGRVTVPDRMAGMNDPPGWSHPGCCLAEFKSMFNNKAVGKTALDQIDCSYLPLRHSE